METRKAKRKNRKAKRLKFARTERAVVLPIRKTPKGNKYAITNYGRVISYTTIPVEGIILKQGKIRKYFGTSVGGKTHLIHRLVALQFVRKHRADQRFVVHLDYNNGNNHYRNLKWTNRDEMEAHQHKNPNPEKRGNQKLTVELVKKIKQKIQEGKITLKIIGKQFGVTDMQIHRIKTGENWGYVKI
ncbi:MAG: hypothetical protein AABY93_17975 [Bacteroidota bacterium]